MWGQEDLATFSASLFRLACEHGYREADEKVFIADGGEWCWGIHDKYFADADGILNWYHASEHVWECGKVLHSADAVKSWVDEGLELLRTAGGEGLLDWLQPQLTGLRGKKRKAMNSLLGYFRSRVGLTNYNVYREKSGKGHPLGCPSPHPLVLKPVCFGSCIWEESENLRCFPVFV